MKTMNLKTWMVVGMMTMSSVMYGSTRVDNRYTGREGDRTEVRVDSRNDKGYSIEVKRGDSKMNKGDRKGVGMEERRDDRKVNDKRMHDEHMTTVRVVNGVTTGVVVGTVLTGILTSLIK